MFDIMPTGPLSAQIMVVQDCPTEPELQFRRPLAGLRGLEFDKMLEQAGLNRGDIFVTSLIRSRIPGNDIVSAICGKREATPAHFAYLDKFVTKEYLDGLETLKKEIELVKPKVIIALGNGALWALTGKWGMKNWRGSELSSEYGIVLPTYSPYHVQRSYSDRAVVVEDLKRAKRIAEGQRSADVGKEIFITKPTIEQVMEVLNNLISACDAGPTWVSNDIETRQGHIACIGLAWSEHEAICIPLLQTGSNPHYWQEYEEGIIAHLLYRLLTHKNCWNIGQNFIYDAQYYYRWFHWVPTFKWDTMIAHHTMFSNQPKGLDYLSSIYCEQHIYWKQESKNWDPKLGEEQLWIYNCRDAVKTYEIAFAEMKAVDKFANAGWPELPQILQFQHDLWWAVLETMNRGIRVTEKDKATLAQELIEEIAKREQWLIDVIGRPVNIKSPKQMTDLFYRELGQKPVISRKTGNPTCDSQALEKIGEREPLLLPVIRVIEELRSLGVFLGTFVTAPLDIDRRMRCSFNIAGTETYRFSSSQNAFGSGMNLQNIPKGDD